MLKTKEEAGKVMCGELREFIATKAFEVGAELGEGKLSKDDFMECIKNLRESAGCAANECMNWRWIEESKTMPVRTKAVGSTKINQKDIPRADWKGYCGLGGKP